VHVMDSTILHLAFIISLDKNDIKPNFSVPKNYLFLSSTLFFN